MARNKDKPTPYEKRGKDGPDDRAVAGAMIDCIMGVPVDPAHGFPQEQVSTLREEIEEMMARGVNRTLGQYASLRKIEIDNSVVPAGIFNPSPFAAPPPATPRP